MLDEAYYPIAKKMAREGATRGMIAQALRRERLPEHQVEALTERAIQASLVRQRLQGLLIAACGGAIIVGAVLSTVLFGPKTPIVIGMFGLFCCGVGFMKLFQRAPRNG